MTQAEAQVHLVPLTREQYMEALEGLAECERDRRQIAAEKRTMREGWKERSEEIADLVDAYLAVVDRWKAENQKGGRE